MRQPSMVLARLPAEAVAVMMLAGCGFQLQMEFLFCNFGAATRTYLFFRAGFHNPTLLLVGRLRTSTFSAHNLTI